MAARDMPMTHEAQEEESKEARGTEAQEEENKDARDTEAEEQSKCDFVAEGNHNPTSPLDESDFVAEGNHNPTSPLDEDILSPEPPRVYGADEWRD